jgi:hypothetical protein
MNYADPDEHGDDEDDLEDLDPLDFDGDQPRVKPIVQAR